MSWAESLIKLANYELEALQKRVAEVARRRVQAEMALALLEATAEAESDYARSNPEASLYHADFLAGMRQRKADALVQLGRIEVEEAGARDALAEAFEVQKKYELVAQNQRLAHARELARRENAELDEIGLRVARSQGPKAGPSLP